MKESLKIFKALCDGEKCVCEIIPHTKRTQSTVSIQLAKLENLGVLKSRRDGKSVYYKLTNKKVKNILKIVNNRSN